MMFIKNIIKKVYKTIKSNNKKYNTINYSDQIIKSLIVTTYVKKKFNILFMMLLTIILRTLLCSFLCIIFSYNLYVDFFLHSFLSIFIILQSHWIYEIINTKKTFFYKITRYAINNYTIENYRRWKRNFLLSISLFGILALLLIEINSYILIYYIVQNLFIFAVVDIIEHNKLNKLFQEIKNKPKNKKYSELTILEDYYILDKDDIQDRTSPENKLSENQLKNLQKNDNSNLFHYE